MAPTIEKSPGQLAYEVHPRYVSYPIPWEKQSPSAKMHWENVASAARQPLLDRIAELENELATIKVASRYALNPEILDQLKDRLQSTDVVDWPDDMAK